MISRIQNELADFSYDLLNTLLMIFHDSIIFWAVQIFLFGLFLYSLAISTYISYKNRQGRSEGVTFKVKRGEKSFKYFVYISSFLITAILAILFTITESGVGYKMILFILDTIVILYLCLWNNWFRNKIVSFVSKIETKMEQ